MLCKLYVYVFSAFWGHFDLCACSESIVYLIEYISHRSSKAPTTAIHVLSLCIRISGSPPCQVNARVNVSDLKGLALIPTRGTENDRRVRHAFKWLDGVRMHSISRSL